MINHLRYSIQKLKQVSWLAAAGFLFCITCLSSCGIYSFSGASISPDTKTFNVSYFENNAPLVVPTLSQAFTEALREKILTSTSLTMVRGNADVEFEGQITDYRVQPIAITGNETAAQNRLTISVKVKYINNKDEEKNYENVFTRYADYPSTRTLADVERDLITQINTQLTEDIFNKSFVNW